MEHEHDRSSLATRALMVLAIVALLVVTYVVSAGPAVWLYRVTGEKPSWLNDLTGLQFLAGIVALAFALWLVLRKQATADVAALKEEERKNASEEGEAATEPAAMPAPMPFITFGVDGSTLIHAGGGAVLAMNAATAEPDPGEPSDDALDIAQRLLAARASTLSKLAHVTTLDASRCCCGRAEASTTCPRRPAAQLASSSLWASTTRTPRSPQRRAFALQPSPTFATLVSLRFEDLRAERGAPELAARAALARLVKQDEAAARALAEPYPDDGEPWHNEEYHHSGLALFTPGDVFHGRVEQVWPARQAAIDSAYREYPERFPNGPPRVPRPPSAVSINPLAIDALSVQPDPSGDDRIHTLSRSTDAAYQTAIAS